jgi:hypothetical protein
MKERNNAKIDLVKEDFTLSEQVEGEAVTVKFLGITCAKYIPKTVTILPEETVIAEVAAEETEEEENNEILTFDEVDSTYFAMSGEDFANNVIAKRIDKHKKPKKAKKQKTQKPKVRKQTIEEQINITTDVFSVPVFGSVADTRTANYALYAMMLENPGYEAVFYPQYEVKISGFGFIYKKTQVKAKARLGKLTD